MTLPDWLADAAEFTDEQAERISEKRLEELKEEAREQRDG